MSPYACPVSQVEMNGKNPFVVVRTTGWVLSERALKQVGLANLQGEYGPFVEDDCIKVCTKPRFSRVSVSRSADLSAVWPCFHHRYSSFTSQTRVPHLHALICVQITPQITNLRTKTSLLYTLDRCQSAPCCGRPRPGFWATWR